LTCRTYEKTDSIFFVSASFVRFHSFYHLGRVSGFDGDESYETTNLYKDHKIAYLRYIAALSMKATNALLKSTDDLNPWCVEENGET